MHDTRKALDEHYKEIAKLEQQIDYLRERIRHEQSNCFHDHTTYGWCDDCDKLLG